MGVQRNEGFVAAGEAIAHPLDLIGMNVGRGVFDGRWQVENDLVVGGGLPDVGDGFANFPGEFEFGTGETLRRIFQAEVGPGGGQGLRVIFYPLRALGGDLDDSGAGGVEDVLALGRGGRVVKMEDRVFSPFQRVKAADDEFLATLAKNLDGDIGGDAVFIDEAAAKIEFDLGGGREADFDFFKADAHEHFEVLEFLFNVHGLCEGLIAVAEIDAAPSGGVREGAVGPLAMRQVDGRKLSVFGDRSRLHSLNFY